MRTNETKPTGKRTNGKRSGGTKANGKRDEDTTQRFELALQQAEAVYDECTRRSQEAVDRVKRATKR